MQLSVIIPSYNGKHLLKANLPAVIKSLHTGLSSGDWEIIVVDDASTDGTAAWITATYPFIYLITNRRNLRFARAVNKGVSRAAGEIVLLINNDVRPRVDFIRPLLRPFSDPLVFAVGCLELNRENRHQLLGGRGVGEFNRGFFVHHRAQDQSRSSTLWVSGGSGAFRKAYWHKLGGFDPLFRPAYEEDRDLSYNALKSGMRLVFEPHSRVAHIHETSNKKVFGLNRIKIMGFKNQFLFVWKNISSPRLLLNHILWLPYHLTVSSIRSRGLFLAGFFTALLQFPQALQSRQQAKSSWRLSDEQVIDQQNQ